MDVERTRRRGMAVARPPLDDHITINVCLDPVDFRKGINGLSVLIEAGFLGSERTVPALG